MWRPEPIKSAWRPARWARFLTPLLTVSLLFGSLDPHQLVHQSQGLVAGAEAHGDDHLDPAHLDDSPVDVLCPACLFGLKNQSRPTEAPGAITRPQARKRLAAATAVAVVAKRSYRLPLGRAPPLS